MFGRFLFEKIYTGFAQGNGDLNSFFSKSQFLWRRQEITYNLHLCNWALTVTDFLLHIYVYLCANNLLQKSEYIFLDK